MFENGKTEVILDFNSLKKGERVRDVAFACFRFGLYKTKDKKEIKKRVRAFLNMYPKNNRLNNEETRNIKHYFVNECLNRISYILRGHYFNKEDEWSFDLKKHVNNIRMADEVMNYG